MALVMRDLLSWNVSLGCWAGVRVRLHAFFFFAAVLILYLCSQDVGRSSLWYGFSATLWLFVAVVVHEFGHCYAVYRIGAQPEQVVLWPLGGMIAPRRFHDLHSEIMVSAAGPLANLVACAVLLPVALASSIGWGDLFNPLRPPLFGEPMSWKLILVQAFWINWVLVWTNLLPAPPMDMSRIIRALTRLAFGSRRSLRITIRIGKFMAAGLLIMAWLVYEPGTSAWLPLTLLGICFFFSARDEAGRAPYQDGEEETFGYDFSQGYTSLERTFDQPTETRPGRVRRWLQQRREARLRRQRQIEEDEDRRVDDILSRLGQTGIEGLSAEERALLERVSHRYRGRLGQ